MEQFLHVLVSVHNNNNKKLTTLVVTKQELPKHEAEQNPTYQIESLEEKINNRLFVEADSLVDKFLSCARIKLSNTLKFDRVKKKFTVKLCSTLSS